MKAQNRHERRAEAARQRRWAKRTDAVLRLSFGLALAADVFKTSRNSARRRLKAEVARRYGADAFPMGVRLMPAKAVVRAV